MAEIWEEYVLGYKYVDGTWRTLYKHTTYAEAQQRLATRPTGQQDLNKLSIAKITIEVINEVVEVINEVTEVVNG